MSTTLGGITRRDKAAEFYEEVVYDGPLQHGWRAELFRYPNRLWRIPADNAAGETWLEQWQFVVRETRRGGRRWAEWSCGLTPLELVSSVRKRLAEIGVNVSFSLLMNDPAVKAALKSGMAAQLESDDTHFFVRIAAGRAFDSAVLLEILKVGPGSYYQACTFWNGNRTSCGWDPTLAGLLRIAKKIQPRLNWAAVEALPEVRARLKAEVAAQMEMKLPATRPDGSEHGGALYRGKVGRLTVTIRDVLGGQGQDAGHALRFRVCVDPDYAAAQRQRVFWDSSLTGALKVARGHWPALDIDSILADSAVRAVLKGEVSAKLGESAESAIFSGGLTAKYVPGFTAASPVNVVLYQIRMSRSETRYRLEIKADSRYFVPVWGFTVSEVISKSRPFLVDTAPIMADPRVRQAMKGELVAALA